MHRLRYHFRYPILCWNPCDCIGGRRTVFVRFERAIGSGLPSRRRGRWLVAPWVLKPLGLALLPSGLGRGLDPGGRDGFQPSRRPGGPAPRRREHRRTLRGVPCVNRHGKCPGSRHAGRPGSPAPRGSGWGHVSEFGSRLSAAAADRLIGAQNEAYPPIWKRAQAVLPHSSMLRMKRAP